MDFCTIDWVDSDLESIQIEYDKAVLTVWNDSLQKRVLITCFGFAGITNLCIWDDTIIMNAGIYPVTEPNSDFIYKLYAAYDKEYDYGGRSLSNGLLELRIQLANQIAFSVYCLKIDVSE